ncbi:MAG: metal-dependent transcriptional regulator [candidate division NC10 bacterium]|nr:metal-dependent transcriptional regulator [candidate division NC10 bacterium]
MEKREKGERIPSMFLEVLEAIYRLEQEGASVSPARLGKRLGLGEAQTMERVLGLQGMGLVETLISGLVLLTAEGERIAVGLIRKHRLIERFLYDVLGLPWDQVHGEAHSLTPVVSDQVGDRLARFLEDPKTCPHGNPIPSTEGALHAEAAVPLHRLNQGKAGVILRIEKEEPALLKYLATLGLLPETKVEVEEVAPFGGPILIRVGGSRYALGRKVASKIFVKEA